MRNIVARITRAPNWTNISPTADLPLAMRP